MKKKIPSRLVCISLGVSLVMHACRLPGLGFLMSSSCLVQVINFEYCYTPYYNRPSLLCRSLLLLKEWMYLLPCACVKRKTILCTHSVCTRSAEFSVDLVRQMSKFKRLSMPDSSMIFHVLCMVYFRSFYKGSV